MEKLSPETQAELGKLYSNLMFTQSAAGKGPEAIASKALDSVIDVVTPEEVETTAALLTGTMLELLAAAGASETARREVTAWIIGKIEAKSIDPTRTKVLLRRLHDRDIPF